jgi:hypothetical protein
MVALRDVEPEAWDRLESLGEWRVQCGEPEPSDPGYWFNVARQIVAPYPPDKECDF